MTKAQRRARAVDQSSDQLVWRRATAGPWLVLAGFAVALDGPTAQRLGIPGPSGPAALLLCIDRDGDPWTRAGDAVTVMGLMAGALEAHAARMLPYVRRGWPQQWPDVPLPDLVPDRLPRAIALRGA